MNSTLPTFSGRLDVGNVEFTALGLACPIPPSRLRRWLSVLAAIVFDIVSAARLPDSAPVPPPPEPQAIRACLAPTLAAEFNREWETVLDRVKQSMDLADLHELLNKWRHTAYLERRDPNSYYRMLTKAEQIMRTGGNPDAAPFEEMQALIRQRQVR